jgi:ABC-type multidrug transport system fused ATPase/permease subunit
VKFAPDDIFEGTLIENLSLGGTLDTYAEVEELVQIVGLQDFIEGSKDGLNKVLYTSGARLSDRIKRKISLMRALLGNPALVLLEEPFLGMEQTCLTRIQQHLLNKMPHSTLMVIANDPLFAQQCDKVIVLEGGSIKAFGTWQEVQPYLN